MKRRLRGLAAIKVLVALTLVLSACAEEETAPGQNPYPVTSQFTQSRQQAICEEQGLTGQACLDEIELQVLWALTAYYTPPGRSNPLKLCELTPQNCVSLQTMEDYFKQYL